MRRFSVVAVILGMAVAAPAAAQSLGEIAAQTRKKREEQKKAGGGAKVITDADLRSGGSGRYQPVDVTGTPAPEPSPAAAGPAAGAAPAGEKPKTDEELAAERQAAWREKLQKAQADIARFNEDIDRYQTALNDIQGPLYGGTRAGLINRLEEAKRNLAAAQQALADTQEEGRRNGWR